MERLLTFISLIAQTEHLVLAARGLGAEMEAASEPLRSWFQWEHSAWLSAAACPLAGQTPGDPW